MYNGEISDDDAKDESDGSAVDQADESTITDSSQSESSLRQVTTDQSDPAGGNLPSENTSGAVGNNSSFVDSGVSSLGKEDASRSSGTEQNAQKKQPTELTPVKLK